MRFVGSSKRIIQLIALIAFLIVVYVLARTYVTLATIQAYRFVLQQYMLEHHVASVALFMAIYVIFAGFSLPGAAVLTLLAGFLFSPLSALVYVGTAATLGATMAFIISRYYMREYVQMKYALQLKRLNTLLLRHGHWYLLLMRLSLVMPFFMVNVAAALTPVRVWTFMWTTALGIIPGSLLYIYAGRALATITNVRDILSWQLLVLSLSLVVIMVITLLVGLKKRE